MSGVDVAVLDLADFMRNFFFLGKSYVIQMESDHVLYLMRRTRHPNGNVKDAEEVLQSILVSVEDDLDRLFANDAGEGEGTVSALEHFERKIPSNWRKIFISLCFEKNIHFQVQIRMESVQPCDRPGDGHWRDLGVYPGDPSRVIATRFTAAVRDVMVKNGKSNFAECFFAIKLRIWRKTACQ